MDADRIVEQEQRRLRTPFEQWVHDTFADPELYLQEHGAVAKHAFEAGRASVAPRSCTCHPDDNPPRPCPQKFALSECRAAAIEERNSGVPREPEHVAWLRFRKRGDNGALWIQVCDSDAPGAFKVYRQPPRNSDVPRDSAQPLALALQWFVDNPGECPGDHPRRLAFARAALMAASMQNDPPRNSDVPREPRLVSQGVDGEGRMYRDYRIFVAPPRDGVQPEPRE